MSTTATLKPGNQRWGSYHTDREYARVRGDPLRTVVEAPTKRAAEEKAARLGFSEPWAHPIAATELRRAQWLANHRPGHWASPGLMDTLEAGRMGFVQLSWFSKSTGVW